MRQIKLAAIPGDGIGTEVVEAGIEVLQAIAQRDGGFVLNVDEFGWGGAYYKAHGRMMPQDGLAQIRDHDAILFGSAGHPDIPDHITLWGLRLAICQPFDQYANVRPSRLLPGIESPLRGVGADRAAHGHGGDRRLLDPRALSIPLPGRSVVLDGDRARGPVGRRVDAHRGRGRDGRP